MHEKINNFAVVVMLKLSRDGNTACPGESEILYQRETISNRATKELVPILNRSKSIRFICFKATGSNNF